MLAAHGHLAAISQVFGALFGGRSQAMAHFAASLQIEGAEKPLSASHTPEGAVLKGRLMHLFREEDEAKAKEEDKP